MLWQTDASKFEWFGKGRGYATLHAYIADATGRGVGTVKDMDEASGGSIRYELGDIVGQSNSMAFSFSLLLQ